MATGDIQNIVEISMCLDIRHMVVRLVQELNIKKKRGIDVDEEEDRGSK
jgi:hypothetical protein